jgi:hypothetical protein
MMAYGSADDVHHQFLRELNKLLLKYEANLECCDEWSGYAECGQDLHVKVAFNGKFNIGDYKSHIEGIDFGKAFYPEAEGGADATNP